VRSEGRLPRTTQSNPPRLPTTRHFALVRRREAGAELACQFERLVRRQPADSTQQRREIFTVDELHREKVLAAGFADVVHATHVRMRDLPGEPNFLMEARQPLGAIGELLRQELERDGLSELQVFRSIVRAMSRTFAHPFPI
jgi:hypothetical protein